MKDSLSVRGIRWFGKNVFALELERDGLEFQPGDCLALFAADGRVSRPYSLASGTSENVLRFVIRLMPKGEVSTYLSTRKPGDLVRISPPFGWFRPGEHADERKFAFIATGTGIAPFLSYLRSNPTKRPECLLYGVREAQDAVDLPWLRSVTTLHAAVSRQDVEGLQRGRVTELLGRLPKGDVDYYLCGLDAMIDEVTNWLEGQGVDLSRIHRECFFNASY